MAGAPQRRTEELARRHRRYLRRGLGLSVIIHLLVLLATRGDRLPLLPFAAAGPPAGGSRAAAGTAHGGLEVVALRPSRPQSEVPPPPPLPVPDMTFELAPQPQPEITPPELDPADFERVQAFAGAGDSGAQSAGRENGTGAGNAGTAAEGRLRAVPPTPRGLILPPADRPSSVRGKEVAVWVFVTATGEVAPDSTRLDPRTGDDDFDERLREQAAEWLFEPARKEGRPVGEWFRYVIIL